MIAKVVLVVLTALKVVGIIVVPEIIQTGISEKINNNKVSFM